MPMNDLPRNYYKVVYADPPWTFRPWSHRGEGKGASRHYPTMNLEAIKTLPVKEIVANDAVLFLWVVQPQLPEALEVVKLGDLNFEPSRSYGSKCHRPGTQTSCLSSKQAFVSNQEWGSATIPAPVPNNAGSPHAAMDTTESNKASNKSFMPRCANTAASQTR